jgi:hypothetical protein
VWRWLARRPFLAWLLVTVAVVVPGYVRQEQTIDEAHSAADRVAEVQHSQEVDRIERAAELCARSVAVRGDNRAMWLFLFDLLAGGELIPQVAAALDELLPRLECDADSVPVPVNEGD